jgi:hypothetical protein
MPTLFPIVLGSRQDAVYRFSIFIRESKVSAVKVFKVLAGGNFLCGFFAGER